MAEGDDTDEEEEDEDDDVVDLDDPRYTVVAEMGHTDGMQEEHDSDSDLGDDQEEEEGGDEEIRPPLQDDAVAVLAGHRKPVHALCHHPTLPLVVSGAEDDLAVVWEYRADRSLHILQGHSDTVVAAGFTFDGKLVATGGMDGVVKLWDVETGELRATLEGLTDSVEWLACHPKGNVLFAGGADGQSAMWNTKGELMQLFSGHGGRVTCGTITVDGKLLITGSEDGTIRVFNPKTAETIHTFDKLRGLPDAVVISLHCSPHHEDVLLAGCEEGTLVWLGIKNGKALKSDRQHQESIEAIDSCAVAPLFATASADGSLAVWDSTAQSLRHKTAGASAVIQVRWWDHNVLSCTADGVLRLWDGRGSGEERQREWRGHRGAIHNFLITPAGEYAITAAEDASCRVFQLQPPPVPAP
eukprot:GGOE01058659.1.p1 GENE.GGOE01058659.1~~GGOE01058659.1.p1  ORF type:complete len:435 (-),score=150.04 GGOE01058659.1:414-1652(-)